jgi:TFIIS helical bundle-like domain
MTAFFVCAGDESGKTLDLLKALAKMKINLTILTNTRIGMTVNTIRYHPGIRTELFIT